MELLMVGLIGVGLTTILAHPAARLLIALAGGAVLVWMGLQMIYQVIQNQIHLPTTQQTGMTLTSRQFVGLGVLTTASNPFWYAWWVTVAAGYLAQAQAAGLAPIIAFYFGHISADYAWYTLLATAIASGRRWMNDRVYRSIFSLCSIFFLYLGGTFLRNGFSLLRNHPLL
jgi:threonine/homoserine/homoserine lactone efflux protein